MDAQWATEVQRASLVFGRRLFPDARTDALARAELLAALPAAHDWLVGASRGAGEIIRQQMVLNAIHGAAEQWSAETGNTAALTAYTEARAEAQTKSAYRAIGRQAETWVPLLRIVFECLYVGVFPMAVLLMLTPAGAGIFRSWVTGLDLAAVLGSPLRHPAPDRHGRGGGADECRGVDAGRRHRHLTGGPGRHPGGGFGRGGDGRATCPCPFPSLPRPLAYGISKATVLATSVLAVGQDAASTAANEGTTGKSVTFQHPAGHAPVFHAGGEAGHVPRPMWTITAIPGYAPGGAGYTVTGDGTVVADVSSATSRIPAAGIRLSESLAASHEARAAEARSLSNHWSRRRRARQGRRR